MTRGSLAIAAAVLAAAGTFVAGRATAPDGTSTATAGGRDLTLSPAYRAGREDAFSGFDGGWALGVPYIVTLRRGPPGVTYAFARRWTMTAGAEYRACGDVVCTRPLNGRP